MEESPTRRAFLAGASSLAAGVTVGLAGCQGQRGGGGLRVETLSVAGSPGTSQAVTRPGTVTVLDFFATWCGPCKPQMDELRSVRQESSSIHLLSLSREDDTEAIRAFWREYDGTWPVAQDPDLEVFRAFDVTRIPTLLVVDPSGAEVWRHSGLAGAETITAEIDSARR